MFSVSWRGLAQNDARSPSARKVLLPSREEDARLRLFDIACPSNTRTAVQYRPLLPPMICVPWAVPLPESGPFHRRASSMRARMLSGH